MFQQITNRSVYTVLAIGFAAVIVLLVAAAAVAVNSARSVKENAAELVAQQATTTRLIEEVETEQEALNAVFYKISRSPESIDRDRIVAELDEADQQISRLPDDGPWRELKRAASGFSSEARRLLNDRRVSSYSTRELFRRHEEVTSLIARLVGRGYQRAIQAEAGIEKRSSRLVRESLILLGACLAAALLCSWLTLRTAAQLFRKMEAQTSELSRVSFHMLENQETTARRFSHELHDELGQSLAAVKSNLAAMPGPSPRLDDCRQLVDDAIRNVRELSQLLRPIILDDFGLDASIRWLAERFTQRTGIEVNYTSGFSGRLADETETHLFRIVQEALTNVARHSGAKHVAIELRRDGANLCLSLQDDGRGLDPAAQANAGMGLIGMRARARGAGGEMTTHSKSGEGLRINVRVPYKEAVPA